MTNVHIRPYESADHDAVLNVFTVTAHDGLHRGGPDVLKFASYLWCRPYLMLEPESCFVLAERKSGDPADRGTAVGYIIGTPDTRIFVQKWLQEFIPSVEDKDGIHKSDIAQKSDMANELHRMIFTPEILLHASTPSLLNEYPAHLHIDILPSHQRRGYGSQMIKTFATHLRNRNASGIHLTMSEENFDAPKFYGKLGFEEYKLNPDPVSGGDTCMVLSV